MARYYQSTPQNFTSQFVPENLELQQGYFDNMQGKQDAYKLQIEGLNKQTNALVNDIPGAVEAKKRIEGRLGELRSLNYNDPQERNKALKGTMELRGAFDTFGELGARDDKKKRYDLAQQEIEKDKNDFKKAYRLTELKQANLAPERAIKFDDYGRPLNTEIIVPEDWEYKDKTPWMSAALKDVFSDTRSVNSGLSEDEAHKALLSYMSGNIEERTGQKIYNSVKQRALADPNLMKSIKAEGLVYGQDPNVIFETALSGLVGGGKYKNTKVETKYRTDAYALKNSDKEDLAATLVGQTLEGQTYNPIANDKNFQDLQTSGVFNINNNGEVKINWAELNKDTPAKTIEPTKSGLSIKGIDPRKPINVPAATSTEKQLQLANQMKKMAEVTGFQGDIKADNYEVIASAYNTYNKARLFGEQLSAPVSNLESSKITRNWEQTTGFDPENINKLVDKPELKEGDKILVTERQTNNKGEIIKKGVIVGKEGERTPFAVKSNSLEDSGYFDIIGNIGITTAKYQVGESNGIGEKDMYGNNIISKQEIPNKNGVTKILSTGNPRDRTDITYQVIPAGAKTKEDLKKFNNYADLQKYLEMEYYTNTPEGISDTNELLKGTQQYNVNFEEQDQP